MPAERRAAAPAAPFRGGFVRFVSKRHLPMQQERYEGGRRRNSLRGCASLLTHRRERHGGRLVGRTRPNPPIAKARKNLERVVPELLWRCAHFPRFKRKDSAGASLPRCANNSRSNDQPPALPPKTRLASIPQQRRGWEWRKNITWRGLAAVSTPDPDRPGQSGALPEQQ